MSDPNPEPTEPTAEPMAEPAAEPTAQPAAAEAPPPEPAAQEPPSQEQPAAQEPAAAEAVAELSPAATGALLAQHFPALFTPGQAKPIKLRIQADIQARTPGLFTKKSLSLFLHRHTTSTPYLKALVASPQRFDLDGQPAGEVAAEHRDAAVAEVERRRAIVMAKRQAERQAQRPPRAAAAAPGEPGAGAVPQQQQPRGDRPPRAERPPRQDRADRRPRGDAQPARPTNRPTNRPPSARHERPPRPDQAQRGHHAQQQQQRPAQPPRPPRPPAEPAPAIDPAIAALGPEEQAARRERALLLRAWETSTLTRANFCVLKRISEADLEAQLAQARQERPANVGVKPGR